MIFLVTAGRGGGEGRPVFATVPWSPLIGERGQLPGSILRQLFTALEMMGQYEGARKAFREANDWQLVEMFLRHGDPEKHRGTHIASALILRWLMIDLGML